MRHPVFENVVMRPFDVIRSRKNVKVLNLMRKSQYWPRKKLLAWQERHLWELLNDARLNSPFYAERLKKFDFRTISSSKGCFRDIPILTRDDLRYRNNELRSLKIPASRFIESSTGGSTGEPRRFYYDKENVDFHRAAFRRSLEWAGVYPGDKVLYVGGSHYDQKRFSNFQRRLHMYVVRSKEMHIPAVTEETMGELYRTIIAYNPKGIYVFASYLHELVKYIDRKGLSGDQLGGKVFFTSSETLYPAWRKRIKSVLNSCMICDHYGAREAYIAAECPENKGYHISADYLMVEIVDEKNRLLPPGKVGRILVTNLLNRAFPMIRYEIGDVGSLSDPGNGCRCGVRLPMLSTIEGRVLDYVTFKGGVLSSLNFNNMFTDFSGILQYQVVQSRQGNVLVRIVRDDSYTVETETKIRYWIEEHSKKGLSVDFEYLDEIPVPKSGKRRYVINTLLPGD